MSTYINNGNQIISWNFQNPLQAQSVNRRFLDILPLGIYSGFTLSAATTAAGSDIVISAGILEIKDTSAAAQIKCQTTTNYSLSGITSAAPVIHAYYVWNDRNDWYVDFVGLSAAVGTSAVVETQYICIGTALFNPASGNITGFNYDDRQVATFSVQVNIESVHDETANFLSAGPGIALTYDDPNGKLEISARGITNIHGQLLGLTADDHTQYLLSDASRQVSNDWNIGQNVSGGKAVSAGTLITPNISAMGITGSRLDLFINDTINNLMSAGPNIQLTFDAPNGKLEISAATSGANVSIDAIQKLAILVSMAGNVDIENSVISQTIDLDAELIGGNYWTTKAYGSIARYQQGGFSLHGFGYNCAGITAQGGAPAGGFTKVNEQYNDMIDVWTTKEELNSSAGGSPIGFSLHGFGYIVAGASGVAVQWSSENQKYNDSLNTWTNKTETNIDHGRAIGWNIGEFGYCVGGQSGTGDLKIRHKKTERYDDRLDTWTYVSDSLIGRYYMVGFELNGLGYSVGGATGPTSGCSSATRYSDTLDIWKYITDLPVAWPNSPDKGAGFSVNSYGYYFGGIDFATPGYYDTMYEYNESANIWLSKMNIPTPASTGGYSYGTLGNESLNGFGYMNGGRNAAGTILSATYQYRNVALVTFPVSFKKTKDIPDTLYIGTNFSGKKMTVPVWLQTDITGAWHYMLSNNIDSITKQGQELSGILSATSASTYDYMIRVGIPKTESVSARSSWSVIAPLLSASAAPASWSLNGYGFISDNSFSMKYGSALNAWTEKSAPPQGLDHCGDFCLNGFGYAFGGVTASIHNDTQTYNELMDTWTLNTYGTIGNNMRPASFTLNKYGYVAGGSTTLGFGTEKSSSYRFDDSTLTWTQMANMGTKRLHPGGFSLQGFGYCGGGRSSIAVIPIYHISVERYNDAANTWSTVDSIAVTRAGQAGMSDRNFGMFAKGVSSVSINDTINSTEIYYPILNLWTMSGPAGAVALTPGRFVLDNHMYTLGGEEPHFPSRGGITECDKRTIPVVNMELTTTLFIE